MKNENKTPKRPYYNKNNKDKNLKPLNKDTPVKNEGEAQRSSSSHKKRGGSRIHNSNPKNNLLRVKGKTFTGSYQEVKIDRVVYEPTCPLCNLVIKDALYAIGIGQNGEAAHFDCVVNLLSTKQNLAEGEKVVYLGGGTFAVALMHEVVDKKAGGSHFTLVRKIDHEQAIKDLVDEWRSSLAIAPSFVVAMKENLVQTEKSEKTTGKLLYADPQIKISADHTKE